MFRMAFWSKKLLETMKDPESIVIKTQELVAIKDKYPKAKHHYLILPYADIDTIYDLRTEHKSLIKDMSSLALHVIELKGQKVDNFKVGFHASPSMARLHLHVISKDFISPCLKTKDHWNSFNTSFLVTPEEVLDDLERHGKIMRNRTGELEKLQKCSISCNSCTYKAKNMPDLRRHLMQHETEYC